MTLADRLRKVAEFDERKSIKGMQGQPPSCTLCWSDGGNFENARLKPALLAAVECVEAAIELHGVVRRGYDDSDKNAIAILTFQMLEPRLAKLDQALKDMEGAG